MSKDRKPDIEFEESSGNVFADLGLEDADELFTRSAPGLSCFQDPGGPEAQAARGGRAAGIKQPEVSHLMNGHFSRFTTDKLLDFLRRLDRKVTIRISPHRPGEPYQEIGVGL